MNFRVKEMYLVLTHQCNLKCVYCFVSQDQRVMSYETAEQAVDFLVSQLDEKQTGSIVFFGGEPMLRWDQVIAPIVKYTEEKYPKKIKFNITSNCVLLNKEKSDFIKQHNIGLLTSFDGCKLVQDFNRPFHSGEGSFNKVYNNLINHRNNGGKLQTMRSTVYPDTAHLMYENYLQAIDMKYYGTFFIPDSFSDFTEEQWEGYKSSLKKVADHYIKYWNDNSKKPLALNNLERIFTQCAEDIRRRELGLDIPSKTNYSRCGIGLTPGIAVSPTGDFYTCQQMTSNEEISKPFLVGNLKDGIDEEKRNNLVDLYYSQQNRKGDMDCSKCSGRSICSGGCLSTNFLIYQELRQNSPTWCRNMRALHEIGEYIVRGLNNNTAFQDFLKELSKRQKTVCEICQEEQSENKW